MASFLDAVKNRIKSVAVKVAGKVAQEAREAAPRIARVLAPVGYAEMKALDVPMMGLLRSRRYGERLEKAGLLSPKAKKVAEVVGSTAGWGLMAVPVGRALNLAGISAALGRSILSRAAAMGLEGALVGAWGGASEARQEGKPVPEGAAKGAVSTAFWSTVPYLGLRELGKVVELARKPLLARASEELGQVKRIFAEYPKAVRVASETGRLMARVLERTSAGHEALRKAGSMALAWLPENELLSPQGWKTTLAQRIAAVEQRAANLGNQEAAAALRSIRAELAQVPDEVIANYAKHLKSVYDAGQNVARRLQRIGLLELWEQPGERYVPLYITERGVRKTGAQVSNLARSLIFTRKPTRFSVHALPRGHTLEDALVKFGPDVVLDTAHTIPFHAMELRQMLERARFVNRLQRLAKLAEQRAASGLGKQPLVGLSLPEQLVADYERMMARRIGRVQQALASVRGLGSPEALALDALERALRGKSVSKRSLEQALRQLSGNHPLAGELQKAMAARGASRRSIAEAVADNLRRVVVSKTQLGADVSTALDEVAAALGKKRLSRKDIEQAVEKAREALKRGAGTLAVESRLESLAQKRLAELEKRPVPRLPRDAQQWLEKRLQYYFRTDSDFKRALMELSRAITRIKVLQPFDWVTQMIYTVAGPAGKGFAEVLSPVNRIVNGLARWRAGKEAFDRVSPELAKLVEAGLDVSGTGWRAETYEALRQPLKSALGVAGHALDRATEAIERLSFGPTVNMRIGLALDLYRRWLPRLGEEEAAKAAASTANYLTGHVDLHTLHPTLQGFLNTLALAPRWLTHTLQLPLVAVGVAPDVTLSPAAQELVSDLAAQYLAHTVTATLALADAVNRQLNNGRHIWENPPGYRHLIDITPLVGTGPRGERQYFDPWFWERDYPRLVQYASKGNLIRYLEFKMAPMWTVAMDLFGYDPTQQRFLGQGLGANLGMALKDLVDLFFPAGTLNVAGAGFSLMGGWSGTPTGRFDLPRWAAELLGVRLTPGSVPSAAVEEKARVKEAARQGMLWKVPARPRAGQATERVVLSQPWMQWLASVLGKVPSQEDVVESLDILGLPPEVRNKAIANVFSPESKALFKKYFRTDPLPAHLWHMRLVFAQDDPRDRERTLQFLFSDSQLSWLARALGKRKEEVTLRDVWQYHRQLMRREKPSDTVLGPGATTRRIEQLAQ